jgi:hypothetical protein
MQESAKARYVLYQKCVERVRSKYFVASHTGRIRSQADCTIGLEKVLTLNEWRKKSET